MAGAIRALDGPAYVLDAHAVVVFLHGEPGAEVVAELLERARAGATRLSLTSLNAGEVILAVERRSGAAAGHLALDLMQVLPIDIVAVDLEIAARAAYLKMRGGISHADCFAGALAHRDGIPVVTGDPEFGRIGDLVEVAWLTG